MYILLGALDGEIELMRKELNQSSDESWRGFPVFRGKLLGQSVAVARTGVGKSLSALLTQRLIDQYRPRGIVFSGIAGALNPAYQVGDLVVARDCVQYDMDVTSLGYKRGQIPHTDYRFFTSPPEYLQMAGEYKPPRGRLHLGRILTGDQFVARTGEGGFYPELAGDAVEMEGASAALAARVNGLPFLLYRTISDKADGTPPKNFRAFLKSAARQNFDFLSYILPLLDQVIPVKPGESG